MKKQNKAALVAVAVLLIFSLSLFGFYIFAVRPNAVRNHMASVYSTKGVMSSEDYRRLADIQTTIEHTGKISDTDVDWTIALLHSKPLVDNTSNENALHRAVFLYLSGVRSFSPSQRSKLFLATAPLASDKDHFVRGMAATTLGEIGDVRALPYLQKMKSDEDTQVRETAARSIKRFVQPSTAK